MVGNNTEVTIKGVPKFAELHVHRIDINTTAEKLSSRLKPSFPEVECESITSKHPELYTSYKVKIFEDNFEKAMTPEVWPSGACISRLFTSRKLKHDNLRFKPNIFLLNVCSLNNDSINLLEIEISSYSDLKFLCLTETHLTEETVFLKKYTGLLISQLLL